MDQHFSILPGEIAGSVDELNMLQSQSNAVHTSIIPTIIAINTTCAMALIVYTTHPVNMDTVNQAIVKTPVVSIGFGGP